MAEDNGPSARRILVEGIEDKHVVLRLLRRMKLEDGVSVEDSRGINSLLEIIEPVVVAPGAETVGIVVDANDDPDSRWRAVAERLRVAGYAVPEEPEAKKGTIIEGGDPVPRIGVWMMPDHQSSGHLEDFVIEMISKDDPEWSRASDYVDAIPEDKRMFGDERRAKLRVWLATKPEPNFMGESIKRGELQTDGPLCRGFCAWLENLLR